MSVVKDSFNNGLEIPILSKQIVEGFISGMHKSPFKGYSAEFLEHKQYSQGMDSKNIDWKLYAKTDKIYVKNYEEETNLRCYIIIDNSASMHYPVSSNENIDNLNKIGFSCVSAASLINLLSSQRDAVSLSLYSNGIDYYSPAKNSKTHTIQLYKELEKTLKSKPVKKTNTIECLNLLGRKIHKRSLVFLFTDMLEAYTDKSELFDALRHFKYNNHEVVLFHVLDPGTEKEFEIGRGSKKIVDVETNDTVELNSEDFKEHYVDKMNKNIDELKKYCAKYKIKYKELSVNKEYKQVLETYLIQRRKLL